MIFTVVSKLKYIVRIAVMILWNILQKFILKKLLRILLLY